MTNSDSYPFLAKYLNNFPENHPLITLFGWNTKYSRYLDHLLSQLDSTKFLSSKVKELRTNSKNYDGIISELEFCAKILQLKPQFIPSKQKGPTPDIKAELGGQEVFFEVKSLLNTDEAINILPRLHLIQSDYVVIVKCDPFLKEEQADAIVELAKDKIKRQKQGNFSLDFADIEIKSKGEFGVKSPKNDKTYGLVLPKELMWVDIEKFRTIIFREFYRKLPQFQSVNNIFWVIDLKRWQYDKEDIEEICYGDITSDTTVGFTHYVGFDRIYKYFDKNMRMFSSFNLMNLIPTLTYPKMNGLFFLSDAKILNGVIVKDNDRLILYVNPFAENQIDVSLLETLKSSIEH